jgi:hypothetical protein
MWLLHGMLKRVARCFGTYQDGDPIQGVSYSEEADFNTDGRVNGADHLHAARPERKADPQGAVGNRRQDK